MYARFGPATSALSTTAFTAPHDSWPITTTNGMCRCSAPYSSVARIDRSITSPAVRTTNNSPRPALKMYSGGTRESAHDSTIANGLWPFVSDWRVTGLSDTGVEAFLTKRSLPTFSRPSDACPAEGSSAVATRDDTMTSVAATEYLKSFTTRESAAPAGA